MPWTNIYSTPDPVEAALLVGKLSAHGIQVVVLDKLDSAYGTFGGKELYVQREAVMPALKILQDEIRTQTAT